MQEVTYMSCYVFEQITVLYCHVIASTSVPCNPIFSDICTEPVTQLVTMAGRAVGLLSTAEDIIPTHKIKYRKMY